MEQPTDYRALYETVNDLLHNEREEMKALNRKAADAQATIAALQVDKEDAQDANRLLRRELDKLREKYDAECVMSEGLQSHLTQRTVELHETQNHLADADNEVEQLRKQLSERTAELEAANGSIEAARRVNNDLQAELERVRGELATYKETKHDAI